MQDQYGGKGIFFVTNFSPLKPVIFGTLFRIEKKIHYLEKN